MTFFYTLAIADGASATMLKLAESTDFFVFAFVELAILFVGISFLVGTINEFVPADRIKSILSEKQGRGYLAGAGLGAITPFCSCSTIPMTVGLIKARAGFGPTMTFLFTSPLVNPIIVGLFFSLFGFRITAIYTVMAMTMAVAAGWLLHRFNFQRFLNEKYFSGETASACGCKSTPAPSQMAMSDLAGDLPMAPGNMAAGVAVAEEPSRWKRIFNDAVKQFVKLMPLITIGLLIGALLHGFVPADIIGEVAGADNLLAVPASAIIGVPLYVRASTLLPIGLSLMGKGMSLGAVVALVIGGAGASLPEVIMLKGIFRWPILIAFLTAVFGMAITTGYIMNLFA
ncbi:MAG: permease [Pseudodesulfovibrio sp.]